jgi:multidrug efflux pump subunit AcrB
MLLENGLRLEKGLNAIGSIFAAEAGIFEPAPGRLRVIGHVVDHDAPSLLTLTESTNTGFFFVTLKPWDERKSRAEQIQAIQISMQQRLGGMSQGLAFAFPPPAIPGIGTAGGVTMILQDRSGNDEPRPRLSTNAQNASSARKGEPESLRRRGSDGQRSRNRSNK